jgi:hypothetical protein
MKKQEVCFRILLIAALLLSAFSLSRRYAAAEVSPSTSIPRTILTLEPGDLSFSANGKPSFLFSRNVAGYKQSHYSIFLDWAKSGGSSFVRIQLDSRGMGYTNTGTVDETWAAAWDWVFGKAKEDGIYILPVFSGWFDWNAGSGYSTWAMNPLNQANGGPVKSPSELFKKGSATQTMWLKWMKNLVDRWRGYDNILGWEIFSEVNLATGAAESSGIDFVNAAAAMIRAADPDRPITASIADTGTWLNFYRKANIDFCNIHPYPPSAKLDRTIVQEVRTYLDKYEKPALIGESGLNAQSPDMYPPNAKIGIRHAVWAAVVSGAMNGRALYWEDSFGLFFPNKGIPWMQEFQTAELPAAEFVKGVDFSGFKPLYANASKGIWGAAVGNENSLLGWYRDAGCEPPQFTLKAVVSGQSVKITVPGNAADWQVDFYNTADGVTLLGSATIVRKGKTILIPLPEFHEDIAFKAFAR